LFESAAMCTYLADLNPDKELISPKRTRVGQDRRRYLDQ